MGKPKPGRAFLWRFIPCLAVSLACLTYPIYVIRPFRAQGAAAVREDDAPVVWAGIVLAAGSSQRMGTPKQLLPLGGRPLLEHVVAAACGSRLEQVVVILGADHELIRQRVDWGRARVMVNPDHALGMSSSLRTGLAALDSDVASAVVILGDQPGISSELVDRMLDVHAGSRRDPGAVDALERARARPGLEGRAAL